MNLQQIEPWGSVMSASVRVALATDWRIDRARDDHDPAHPVREVVAQPLEVAFVGLLAAAQQHQARVHLAWLGAGVGLGQLDLSGRAQRAINIGMALALIGVVLLSAREML